MLLGIAGPVELEDDRFYVLVLRCGFVFVFRRGMGSIELFNICHHDDLCAIR